MTVASIFLPLLSFFICLILNNFFNKRFLSVISVLLISISAYFSFFVLKSVINENIIYEIFLFKWLGSGDLLSNWSIRIDFLSGIMIFIVNLVSASSTSKALLN